MLTEKGKQELGNNEYVTYSHWKHYDDVGLNIYTVNQLMSQQETTDYKSVIIQFLLQKDKPSYFAVGNILIEDEKYNEALKYLIADLYIFLSGVPDKFDPNLEQYLYDTFLEANFPYEKSLCHIPVGRLKPLGKVFEKLNMTYKQLEQHILNVVSQIKQHQLFFTDNECADIIISELKGDVENLKKIYARAERKYRAKFEQ